ncbi:MAG: enoyl-CoA hydratase/isomerase family protein [Burkholderiales bacterium]
MSADPPPPAGPPLLHIADGRATITLNRPAHLNRLHREDLRTLQAYIRQVDADPSVRVLVLTGQGRVFCAGYHLGEFSAGDGPAHVAAAEGPDLFEKTVDALQALALPTICRFNGSVYGGATDLALACDFRIGPSSMELRMPAARLGLHYYPNGLRRYVARLGLRAAKRLFLLAEATPAAQLLGIGYLDQVVAAEDLDAAVDELAGTLALGAPLAMRGMKRSLDEIAVGSAVPDVIRAREALCAASADLQEGLRAWGERRPARFEGR